METTPTVVVLHESSIASLSAMLRQIEGTVSISATSAGAISQSLQDVRITTITPNVVDVGQQMLNNSAPSLFLGALLLILVS